MWICEMQKNNPQIQKVLPRRDSAPGFEIPGSTPWGLLFHNLVTPIPHPQDFLPIPSKWLDTVSISCQSKSASVKLFFLIESLVMLQWNYKNTTTDPFSTSLDPPLFRTLVLLCWARICMVFKSRSVVVSIA